MESIGERLNKIKGDIPNGVTLVAVSKTKPVSDIWEAYSAGQRHFGENKIQEMQGKYEELPKDIFWHMIGHVQTNKVKYMASFVHLIHGVESEKLLVEIDKRARQNNRIIDCLLQVFIADEESKFGLDKDELAYLMQDEVLNKYPNVRIRGLMGMATFTDDQNKIASEFSNLKSLFNIYHSKIEHFDILSMGMSGDYNLAIENGSNLVRIGSSIFGSR